MGSTKLVWATICICGLAAMASAVEPPKGGRLLATRPLYPAARADSVNRPGFNGNLWIGRPIIGSVGPEYPLGWNDPGPAGYGAPEHDFSRAFVKVGTETIEISPWEAINEGGLSRLEHGRQEWLKERGYVGGVRTFVNDTVLLGVASPVSAQIEPRASFEWPIDQPRFRHRQQVQSGPAAAPAFVLKAGDRVSWPMNAPADVVARAEQQTATGEVASAK